MALKGDRQEIRGDISFFMNEVASIGGIVSLSTAGSGAALDQSAALVTYAASASGSQPLGMLMDPELVNLDTSKYPLNKDKLEQRIGAKVHLMTNGWAVTNAVITGAYGAPIAGSGAFLSGSGNVEVGPPLNSTIKHISGFYQPRVGKFLSTLDQDGYVKLSVEL
jgi:hypothetical protein